MNTTEDASPALKYSQNEGILDEINQSNRISLTATLDDELTPIVDVSEPFLSIENNGLEHTHDADAAFTDSSNHTEANQSRSLRPFLQHLLSSNTRVDSEDEMDYLDNISNAAYLGDWRRVDKYITMGVDVNCTSPVTTRFVYDAFPLFAALESRVAGKKLGDNSGSDLTIGEYIASRLIESRADVNIFNGTFMPLHFAALTGQTAIVKLLLKSGFGVNNRLAHSLLTCNFGFNLHIVESLVNFSSTYNSGVFGRWLNGNYGVNMRLPYSHTTALHLASTYEVTQALIDARADINACLDTDKTPLLEAAKNGYDGAVECLLQHKAQIELSTSGGVKTKSALVAAIAYNRVSTVDILLQYKADPNVHLRDEPRPLSEAVRNPDPSTVILDKLLEYGADPNVSPSWPPLIAVATGTHKDRAGFAESLIRWKADVNHIVFNRTPLHFALALNSISVAEVLIRNNADLNTVDSSEFTCLHTVVENADIYSTDVLQSLLFCIQEHLQE